MPKPEEKSYYCSKCNRTKNGIDFYASNNLEKYPNEGKLNMCKECIDKAINDLNDEILIITGSLHFISMVREYLIK
jgi:folylpolyglutamate synthase/dihydropteroate synthase